MKALFCPGSATESSCCLVTVAIERIYKIKNMQIVNTVGLAALLHAKQQRSKNSIS